MALGFGIKSIGLIEEESFKKINRLIFYLGIPALVFLSIIESDMPLKDYGSFALWIVTAFVIAFLLLLLLVPRFEKDNRRRGVLVQGMLRSNDAVFGLAVATAFLGKDNLAVMSFAVALSVPVLNMLGVLSLEIFRGGRLRPWRMLLDIIKNPIIIAVIVGFIVKYSGLALPKVLIVPIEHLSNMCTPLAFIVLGGILSFKSVRENRKAHIWVCLVKLVLLPLIAVGTAILMGYRGDMLLAILILFGAPSAMSSFPLALAMGGDGKLAGEQVAITTALSLFTMFLFLLFLQLGGVL